MSVCSKEEWRVTIEADEEDEVEARGKISRAYDAHSRRAFVYYYIIGFYVTTRTVMMNNELFPGVPLSQFSNVVIMNT